MNQPCDDSLLAILQQAIQTNAFAQSHIFISPLEHLLQNTVHALARIILCQKGYASSSSCQCVSCQYDSIDQHPDVTIMGSTTELSSVKVSTIRELSSIFYIKPHIAPKRIIILHSLSTLNPYAGNALLKIVEEPPPHLIFLLTCPHIATVLPTLISRCQRWTLKSTLLKESDYLEMNPDIGENSPKAPILHDKIELLTSICAIKNGALSPYDVADEWKKYDSQGLLWFLYLVTTLAIKCQYVRKIDQSSQAAKFIDEITALDQESLFKQIAILTHGIKQKLQGVLINETLLLEEILTLFQGKMHV